MRQPSGRELFQMVGTQLEQLGRKVQAHREKQSAKARATEKTGAADERPTATPIPFEKFLEQSRAKLASMRSTRAPEASQAKAPEPEAPKPRVTVEFDPKARAREQDDRKRTRPNRRNRITLDREFNTTAARKDPFARAPTPRAPAQATDETSAPSATPQAPPANASSRPASEPASAAPPPMTPEPANASSRPASPTPPPATPEPAAVNDGNSARATEPTTESLTRLERMLSERLLKIEESIAELRGELRTIKETLARESAPDSGQGDVPHEPTQHDGVPRKIAREPAPDPDVRVARPNNAASDSDPTRDAAPECVAEIQVEWDASRVLLRLPPPQALLKRLDAIEEKLTRVVDHESGGRLRLVDARAGPESESARAPPGP